MKDEWSLHSRYFFLAFSHPMRPPSFIFYHMIWICFSNQKPHFVTIDSFFSKCYQIEFHDKLNYLSHFLHTRSWN